MLVWQAVHLLSQFPRDAEVRIDSGDFSLDMKSFFYVDSTHRVYIQPEPAVHNTGRK